MQTTMQSATDQTGADSIHPDGRHVARSNTTRLIHLLLLVVVVNQIAGSQFMERPLPGEPQFSVYVVHQYAGLAGFAVVVAFWIWALVRRGETRVARMVPWLSLAGWRAVTADAAQQVRRLVRGRAPDDDDGALSSAVHGLGLLAVTAMAASGTVWFFAHGTPAAHFAMSVHKLVANLVWIYLFGHAGLALLHHALGSDIFARMFWTRRDARLPSR